MTTLLLAAALAVAYPPADIDFAAPAAKLARYDGCKVRVTFKVAVPAWEMLGVTVLGAKDVDEFSRAAYVPTCISDKGDTVTVVGTLRYVHRPAKGRFKAWNEIAIVAEGLNLAP
ncbi:hypothetical protein PX52LOC_06902 [Limnoglobus roseus]|uniref:Uncharacterized protein n=1 Tax=Limnoglobus roseus TaxID=2598579 RepID=A0A5C1AKT2_9BACT|nr:hypothetical protein PX52LOC_06902 [Limnoglobus roseus]